MLDEAQFLQIDFIHEVRITKLLVQGLNAHVGVELFVLAYSLDDKNWRNYTEYGTTRVGRYLVVSAIGCWLHSGKCVSLSSL